MSSSRMPAYQRQKVKFATNSCSSIYRPHEPSELIDAADVVGSIERYIILWDGQISLDGQQCHQNVFWDVSSLNIFL